MGYADNFYAALAQDSINAYGIQTAPSAGTVICSVNLTIGVWDICPYASYGAVAGSFDDMKLRNTTDSQDLISNLPVAAAANAQPIVVPVRKRFTKTTTVAIQNIGIGPASSVYRGIIVARLIESANL